MNGYSPRALKSVDVARRVFDRLARTNLAGRAPWEARARSDRERARRPEFGLPVVDVAHLVALKLLAGSRKDELDVLELLGANPEMSVDRILEVCRRHRLGRRLDTLLSRKRR